MHVRLPEDLENQLDKLVEETGRSKSYYVREAIGAYLEDKYDTLMALEVLAKGEQRITLEELKAHLDLDH